MSDKWSEFEIHITLSVVSKKNAVVCVGEILDAASEAIKKELAKQECLGTDYHLETKNKETPNDH